jgi:hypothetical protein
MTQLLSELETKKIIEDDDGPYGAMILLAAKPNQEHVHWSEYVFSLCVSYRLLNAITRPFAYPIRRCDNAAQKMGNCEYAITLDYDSGFWQMPIESQSRDKTGFFTPDGKKHYNHLPMGIKKQGWLMFA